jgi:Zn-dependent protease with chaperone function
MSLNKRLNWSIVPLLAALAFSQSSGPTFPDPGKTSMSRDKQRELGMQTAAQVYQTMPVLPDDSPETQYIRQLGQKLVATIPAEHSWPFEFHVIPQKDINAFALPGGEMFVNVGTIVAAKNEAELGGVMGHEMSHVYMQHSAKQAGKEETTSVLAGLASAVLGGVGGSQGGGLVGELGQMGIQMGAQGLMMKYSRTDESQADAVGAVILYKAGYNPQAMADFFQMLAAQGGSGGPSFFSDHPNSANREEAIQKEIANWPPQDYVADSPEFQQIREHAMGIKTYTAQEIQGAAKSGQWAAMNQKNGATFQPNSAAAQSSVAGPQPSVAGPPPSAASPQSRGRAGAPSARASADRSASLAASSVPLQSVMPSPDMPSEAFGPLTILRPKNWLVTAPQQQGQFVTIAPKAGITNGAVGYGVLLNGIAAPKQPMSIDDMTAQLIQQMEKSNDLQQSSKPEPITVGGVEGRSTFLHSSSPFPDANGQTQQERDWLVTVPRSDGSMIFMVFVAPEIDFARLQPTFDSMLKSLQLQ